jgi:hypothetical protein
MSRLGKRRGFSGQISQGGTEPKFKQWLTIYLAIIVATPEDTPRQSNGNAVGCGLIAIVIFLVGTSVACYSFLDWSGWVPHSKSVDLYISGDWNPGEDRNCLGVQSRLPGEPPQITSMDCRIDGSAENPHNRNQIEIKFFGKTSRPDLLVSDSIAFEWRCRREKSGFTCYATN